MPLFDDLNGAASRLMHESEDVLAEESSLQDRMIQTYSHQVADLVLKACDTFERDHNEALLLEALQGLLKTNWALVKGTALAYTALSEYAVTHLLCDIATFIAQQTPAPLAPAAAIPAIAILMPGLSLDSISEDIDAASHRCYPDFDAKTDLPRVLSTHILDHSNQSLIPVRLLTSIETSEHSQSLMNPYYNYSIKEMLPNLNAEELERLSEHSALTRDVLTAKK